MVWFDFFVVYLLRGNNKGKVMVKQFLAILVLLAIAMLFLAVRILLKKGGKFHSLHVGQSKAMRDRGIHCAQSTDKIEYNDKKKPEDMEK